MKSAKVLREAVLIEDGRECSTFGPGKTNELVYGLLRATDHYFGGFLEVHAKDIKIVIRRTVGRLKNGQLKQVDEKTYSLDEAKKVASLAGQKIKNILDARYRIID